MISVKDLSFSYPKSSEQILKNINFEIKEGEIFGFLGPSGAGKSTTQKILYKILHGFEGEILIHGKPLQEWDKTYLEKIGVGFELPNHYLKLTGKENLELFSSFYKKEKLQSIPDLFAMVGLEDAINKNVEEYSKGMKMRLNFIRAILHNPDLLFFDEPTAGLDPGNAIKIKDHIRRLKKEGKTIFITTHNMTTADELCDRVSFIVNGELRTTDTPTSLKHQYGKEIVKVELENKEIQEFELKDLGQNKSFTQFIQKDKVLRINTLEATLEEVFIKVTGEKLQG